MGALSGSMLVTLPGAKMMLPVVSSVPDSRCTVPRVSTEVVDITTPAWVTSWPTSVMSPRVAVMRPLLTVSPTLPGGAGGAGGQRGAHAGGGGEAACHLAALHGCGLVAGGAVAGLQYEILARGQHGLTAGGGDLAVVGDRAAQQHHIAARRGRRGGGGGGEDGALIDHHGAGGGRAGEAGHEAFAVRGLRAVDAGGELGGADIGHRRDQRAEVHLRPGAEHDAVGVDDEDPCPGR